MRLCIDQSKQTEFRSSAQLVQDDNWIPGESGYSSAQELVFIEVDFPIERIRTRHPDKPFSWTSWFAGEQEMHEEEGRPGYYDSLLNSEIVQPVVIYDDGEFGYVWDGYHRVGASVTKGLATVKAIVGCRQQALELHIKLDDAEVANYLHLKLRMKMSNNAYQATEEDVQNVLHSNSLAAANTNGKSFESISNEVFGDLDFDLIEQAALFGNDLNEQKDYANDEIARQLREIGIIEPLRDVSTEFDKG